MIVAVGLGRDEILTPANRQARIVVGLGIAALSLPLIMMVILSREVSSRVESAIALDQESEKVRQEHTALLSISEELAQERMKLRRTNLAYPVNAHTHYILSRFVRGGIRFTPTSRRVRVWA